MENVGFGDRGGELRTALLEGAEACAAVVGGLVGFVGEVFEASERGEGGARVVFEVVFDARDEVDV